MEDGKHTTNGKLVDLSFEAAPAGGTKVSLVAKRDGQAIHLDRVDFLSSKDRQRFFADLSVLLKSDPEVLFTAFNTALIEAASKALTMAEELAKQQAPTDDDKQQGRPLEIAEHPPWESPVDLASVLNEHVEFLRRHVVLPLESAVACVLWTATTHFSKFFDTAPLLIVRSPMMRSGKTRLGRLLAKSAARSIFLTSITPSALFRTIAATQPTIFIDESDVFVAGDENLRGMLNCGISRDESFVIRTVGDSFEPRMFTTFCHKCLIGIGRLASTIQDRGIIVTMHRKLPTEHVEQITKRALSTAFDLGRKYARAALDYAEKIPEDPDPDLPAALNDRARDVWRSAITLCDIAGGKWPELGRRAAEVLSGEETKPLDETPLKLLRDIVERLGDREAVSGGEIAETLGGDKDSEWATYSRGKPISPNSVGRLLERFDLVKVKDSDGRRRYRMADIKAMLRRYAPNAIAVIAVDDANPCGTTTYGTAITPTQLADGNCENPNCRNATPCDSTTYDEYGNYGNYVPGDTNDGQECEWVF
jgi:hypothetical protein